MFLFRAATIPSVRSPFEISSRPEDAQTEVTLESRIDLRLRNDEPLKRKERERKGEKKEKEKERSTLTRSALRRIVLEKVNSFAYNSRSTAAFPP